MQFVCEREREKLCEITINVVALLAISNYVDKKVITKKSNL